MPKPFSLPRPSHLFRLCHRPRPLRPATALPLAAVGTAGGTALRATAEGMRLGPKVHAGVALP